MAAACAGAPVPAPSGVRVDVHIHDSESVTFDGRRMKWGDFFGAMKAMVQAATGPDDLPFIYMETDDPFKGAGGYDSRRAIDMNRFLGGLAGAGVRSFQLPDR